MQKSISRTQMMNKNLAIQKEICKNRETRMH